MRKRGDVQGLAERTHHNAHAHKRARKCAPIHSKMEVRTLEPHQTYRDGRSLLFFASAVELWPRRAHNEIQGR